MKYPDDLYEPAKAAVIQARRASITFVQKQFEIGYNRAARLIEQMEEDGVVSMPARDGTRTVLVGS